MKKKPETSAKVHGPYGHHKHLRSDGKRLANKSTRAIGKTEVKRIKEEMLAVLDEPVQEID